MSTFLNGWNKVQRVRASTCHVTTPHCSSSVDIRNSRNITAGKHEPTVISRKACAVVLHKQRAYASSKTSVLQLAKGHFQALSNRCVVLVDNKS